MEFFYYIYQAFTLPYYRSERCGKGVCQAKQTITNQSVFTEMNHLTGKRRVAAV